MIKNSFENCDNLATFYKERLITQKSTIKHKHFIFKVSSHIQKFLFVFLGKEAKIFDE